jgi:hypothetical protein
MLICLYGNFLGVHCPQVFGKIGRLDYHPFIVAKNATAPRVKKIFYKPWLAWVKR